jgi:integrase
VADIKRVSKKYWKKGQECYYCYITHSDGRREQRKLDPDEDTAEGIRLGLMDQVKKSGRISLDCTVDRLVQEFLEFAQKNNAEATYNWYLHFLQSFRDHVGYELLVRDFGLAHVNGWLAKHYPAKGNPNTRHNAIAAVKRLFNWATKEMEYFDRNPLAALKKPARTHRDACPTREQWDKVMAHYKKRRDDLFCDFLAVIRATGCRPQEMRVIAARHLDFQAGVIHLEDGEIPGKKFGRDIIIPESVADVLKRLAQKHPEGPLFRNENGKPWTKDSLNCRFQRLQRKLKFRINSYSARHSKATDILENGGSAGAVASLLGHRDPTVVLRFYGKHIEQRAAHLRGLMNGSAPTTTPQQPEPEKGEKNGQPEPPQADDNPHGLKAIGEVPPPKPEPKSKRRKRDAG